MPIEYSWEIRERAEELYIVDGLTFERAAEATGVSVSQLKRWAGEAAPAWTERRREYRRALGNIRRDTVLLKSKLIKNALQSLDPQQIYAFSRLTAATRAASVDETPAPTMAPEPARSIKTPAEAVDALSDAIERRLNSLLTRPGELSFAAIKDVKQAMEMTEQLRAKYKPTGGNPADNQELSAEAAAEVRAALEMAYGA